MNGTPRKAAARERASRYTDDGLPRDGKLWTIDDWRTLYEHMEAARREIAARHRREDAT